MQFMIALQHLWDPTEGVYDESLKGFVGATAIIFLPEAVSLRSMWNCETTRFIHATHQ